MSSPIKSYKIEVQFISHCDDDDGESLCDLGHATFTCPICGGCTVP
jgi:hypothetical protein